MLRQFLPARDDAQARPNDDLICDLDKIITNRVTFKYQGRVRKLMPVTTQRLMAFWAASQDYQKDAHSTPEDSNKAFLKIVKTICDDLSLAEVSSMSVVQKANLVEHITRKITGQESLLDSVKKKVTASPSS